MSDFHIEGLQELENKLTELGVSVGQKTLRAATSAAILPTKRKMKAAVPVGKIEHKTFKGRYVAPGFLQRSVKHLSRFDKKTGTASVRIGVKKEAYYGVSFVDKGTVKMAAQPWFKSIFETDAHNIVNIFKEKLREKILRAAR